LFDVAHYLRSVPDAEEAAAPLQHYLRHGWRRHSSPFPLFDEAFYRTQEAGPLGEGQNPYVAYLSDFSHQSSPHRHFDPAFYLGSAPDAAEFRGSLLEHFVRFGAASGVRPHRLTALATASPSRHSGFASSLSFTDATGRLRWLWSADTEGELERCTDDVGQFEPGLSSDLLANCQLHLGSIPISGAPRALIAIAVKIARCNCLVASEAALDDSLVWPLGSARLQLVSSARPWLTLLSAGGPLVRYWHMRAGYKESFAIGERSGFNAGAAIFIAQAVVAALPEKLVINTDSLGMALLRGRAKQIFGAVREVVLLLQVDGLPASDRQWISEFLSTRYHEVKGVLCADQRSAELVRDIGLDLAEDFPPVIFLEEPGS
jgi:hypothetical protein